jgi:hypothetical protein
VENILRIDPNVTLMFWDIKEDGSLRNNGREFVTPGVIPVSLTESALTQLFACLNEDIDFSNRTSIHVHMDVRQLSLQQMVALLLVYTTVENLLFKFVGNNRRTNIFCVPIVETNLLSDMRLDPKVFMHSIDRMWSKYSALNLLPIVSQGSIEFRHMPGTRDVHTIVTWIDMISRLKTFVYKNSYDSIVNQILHLNSNSMYRQFVDQVFDSLVTYLDTSNLLKDMEKPVWLAKNCASVNAFDLRVTTKPEEKSHLGQRFGMWMKKLSVKQYRALVGFASTIHNSSDLEELFLQIVDEPNAWIRAYPRHKNLIECIITPGETATKKELIIDPLEEYSVWTTLDMPGGDSF